jgi:putative SOS response-associated peptidase YedK
MCNLYSVTKGQAAIVELTRALRDKTGNLPPYPGVFPDFEAPIVRNALDAARELTCARWGMPTPTNFLMDAVRKKTTKLDAKGKDYDFKELLRMA